VVAEDIVKEVTFNTDGLVVAIVQDCNNSEALMVAYMNEEALRHTLESGKMTYYSRSRKKLWVKGETSGHVQLVKEVRIDCDGDALLFKVDQKKAACHMGYRSCFFRKLQDNVWNIVEDKIFDEKQVYRD